MSLEYKTEFNFENVKLFVPTFAVLAAAGGGKKGKTALTLKSIKAELDAIKNKSTKSSNEKKNPDAEVVSLSKGKTKITRLYSQSSLFLYHIRCVICRRTVVESQVSLKS